MGTCLNSIHTQYLAGIMLYILHGIVKPKNRLTIARDCVIDIINLYYIETRMILLGCFSCNKYYYCHLIYNQKPTLVTYLLLLEHEFILTKRELRNKYHGLNSKIQMTESEVIR